MVGPLLVDTASESVLEPTHPFMSVTVKLTLYWPALAYVCMVEPITLEVVPSPNVQFAFCKTPGPVYVNWTGNGVHPESTFTLNVGTGNGETATFTLPVSFVPAHPPVPSTV
jgi:hypothetical protein